MLVLSSVVSFLTFVFLVTAFALLSRGYALRGLALPCMSLLTSLIYFYLMPGLGQVEDIVFLGLTITSFDYIHWSVLLYSLGVVAACFVYPAPLYCDPVAPLAVERRLSMSILFMLFGVCAAAILSLSLSGFLNIFGQADYDTSDDLSGVSFLNLFLTTLIPLAIVVLVRYDFNRYALALTLLVAYIIYLAAFRYRLVFLVFGAAVAFMLTRKIPIRLRYVLSGMAVGVFASNALVSARSGYGQGFDISRLDGMSFVDIMRAFSGEVGPLFVLNYIAEKPLDPLIYFDPWIVTAVGLFPRALWPDKPYPDYLMRYHEGVGIEIGRAAGVAAPQHAEMLLQFGWLGLPFLACLYFLIILVLLGSMRKLSREARIAGFALVPVVFGFYMQTRGYLFQTFTDGLFTFGPLFLLSLGRARVTKRASASAAGTDAPALRF